jgi:hypothetical protein
MIEKPRHEASRRVLFSLVLVLLIVGLASTTAALPGKHNSPPATETEALASIPSASPASATASRLPAATAPTPSNASVERVANTILSYIDGQRAGDALLEIQEGVWVKSSNYGGVTIDGAVYYYAIVTHQSFDPLSRGAVTAGAIEIVTEIDDGDFPIVIYRITNDASPQTGS